MKVDHDIEDNGYSSVDITLSPKSLAELNAGNDIHAGFGTVCTGSCDDADVDLDSPSGNVDVLVTQQDIKLLLSGESITASSCGVCVTLNRQDLPARISGADIFGLVLPRPVASVEENDHGSNRGHSGEDGERHEDRSHYQEQETGEDLEEAPIAVRSRHFLDSSLDYCSSVQ